MKSHRKSPTPEQKAAAQARRADLIIRTRPLQAARKSGLLPWAELPTINACLELIYTGETGQTEWKTFLGWKDAGFGVVKGEKGFPIWGRPINCRDAADAQNRTPGEHAFEFFPVSISSTRDRSSTRTGTNPPQRPG